MKRYRFKLQTVLDVRERDEDRARQGFYEAQQRLRNENRRLQNLSDRREKCFENIRGLRGARISAADEMNYAQYLSQLNRRISAQTVKVSQEREKTEEAREHLVTAMKDKKVFERLKEQDYEAFLAQMQTAEQNFLDELASQTHHRQRQPTG